VFDPDYTWHTAARIWQRTGPGEALVTRAMTRTPVPVVRALLRPVLRLAGVDEVTAREVADGYDQEMGRCILSLYRSARQPAMARLGQGLPAAASRPGLAILATRDPFVGTAAQRRRSAERAGARVEVLDGLGHFWMAWGEGRRAAAALDRFWSSLERAP
jgi:hypothetical protein